MKVGVLGCGHLGSLHARVYSEMKDLELTGVFDTSPEARLKVATARGCRAFDSARDLFKAVDAVSVCVPTPNHASEVLDALSEGCHVLVEKPIAVEVSEAEEMIDQASSANLGLMVGHVERFNPAMIAAMPELGNPGFVESHRLAPFGARGSDVAVILDLMIHDIDLLRSILGREVLDVDASGVSVLSGDIDIANARLHFEGGCVANITASRISRERMRKIRFFQEDSYLSVDLMAGEVEVHRKRSNFAGEVAAALAAEGGLAALKPEDIIETRNLEVGSQEPLRLELEGFISSLRDGQQVPVTGEDGLKALQLAHRIMAKVGHGN